MVTGDACWGRPSSPTVVTASTPSSRGEAATAMRYGNANGSTKPSL
jgi:hypothetical protein